MTLREWQTGDEAAAVRWSRDRAFCQANGWTPELSAQQVIAALYPNLAAPAEDVDVMQDVEEDVPDAPENGTDES